MPAGSRYRRYNGRYGGYGGYGGGEFLFGLLVVKR